MASGKKPLTVNVRCAIHGVNEWRGDIICKVCGLIYSDVVNDPPPVNCEGCGLKITLSLKLSSGYNHDGTADLVCPLCVANITSINPRRSRR